MAPLHPPKPGVDGGLHRGHPRPATRPGEALSPAGDADFSAIGDAAFHPELRNPDSVLGLQRQAGNSAVVSLLEPAGPAHRAGTTAHGAARSVQRDELTPADDEEGYTKPGGKKNVAGTGTTRVEVTGLKFGVKGGFQKEYKNSRVTIPSSEKQMTKESPDNTAVVIMPDAFDRNQPLQVVLHFHGWGFRRGDPYPGYAVSTGKPTSDQGAQNTVRDVDQEHWEQQISAVSKERAKNPKDPTSTAGPQIVAILAQGRGMSDFGDVPTFDYVQDVFSKIKELNGIDKYTIILTAHSGGGDKQVAAKVGKGDAVGADRSKIPAPGPGRAAKQPSDLVVLFDAEGMSAVMDWIVTEIDKLATAVRPPATPDAAQAAIHAAPKFRGYFATRGAYWDPFHDASTRLEKALKAIPAPWRDVDPADAKAVRALDLFRFIEIKDKGIDHEHVISGVTSGPAEAGSLADALRASLSPTIDRAKAYDPVEGAPRLAKWHEEVKAWKAAQAAKEKAQKEKAQKEKAQKEKAEKDKGGSTPASPPAGSPTAPKVQRVPLTVTTPPTVQRDDPTPATTPPTTTPPRPAPTPSWRTSDATSQYALTADDQVLLAGKTPDQRGADRASLDKAALTRLNALAKAERKNTLKPGEDKELADLRTLKDLVETTQRALKRKDVEDVIAAAGQGTVAQWFGAVQKGTFLGISLHAHRSLADRLTRAEASLVADPTVNPGKSAAKELGTTLKMYASTSDLRQPAKAVGGNTLSMHTFGLAVDLNYKGNPFIGNAGPLAPEVIRRATSLVTGTATNVVTDLGDPKAAYATLKASSKALKTYLSYREPANLPALTAAVTGHASVRGEPTDVAGWLTRIEKDHTDLGAGGDFENHKSPDEGFIDLDEAVVLALTGAGLTWGGTYSGTKDIMHFDLREAEGAKINAARAAHTDNR